MKQNTEERKVHAKQKGTVLLTVVGVMMVMVVLLMSTLILTSSANRRSYYTFYQNQAQYAAQSALDVISNQLYSYNGNCGGDSSFYDWVKNNVTDSTQHEITLDYSGTGSLMNLENGRVTCYIEKMDDKNFIWDNENGQLAIRDAWKITATAVVGGGRNRSEYTVCNYLYDNRSPSAPASVTPQNRTDNGRLVDQLTDPTVTPGGGSASPYAQAIDLAKAVSSLGKATGQNADNISSLGPYATGLSDLPHGRGNYDAYGIDNSITNNAGAIGNMTIIGNTNVSVALDFVAQASGEGAQVYGNLSFTNNNHFTATMPYGIPAEYHELAYLYVDGRISTSQQQWFGDVGQPFNVYAGSVSFCGGSWNNNGQTMYGDMNGGVTIYGDMYLYDPSQSSALCANGGGTRLTQFASNVVNKGNVTGDGRVCGSIICNNASLDLNNANIDGDLIFTNPAGVLNIRGNVNVGGAVICAGTLVKDNGWGGTPNLNAAGGVYARVGNNNVVADTDITNVTIKTINRTVPANQLFSTYSYPGYPTATATDGSVVGTYVSNLSAYVNSSYDSANYNYSLIPFNSRLDEIHEEYVRWDLPCSSEADVSNYISTDPLIGESCAAGHQWGAVLKQSDAGSYYYPCTHPINSYNATYYQDVSFIPALNPVQTSLLPTQITYYNSEATFLNTFPASASNSVSYDASNLTNVYVHGHTSTGADASTTLNCFVINESCTFDLSSVPMNTTSYIFIDPTYKKTYSETSPMTIDFINSASNISDNTVFIINNTGVYTGGYAQAQFDPYCATDSVKYASKSDVLIFFSASGSTYKEMTNKSLNIVMSGAYSQFTNKNINMISNPYYPGQDAWKNIAVGNPDKYAFELVPNTIIYAEAGVTYMVGQNGMFINAVVMAPDSTFGSKAHMGNWTYRYREYQESIAYAGTKNMDFSAAGVVYVGGLIGENVPTFAYLGDSNRPGGSPGTTVNPTIGWADTNNGQSDLNTPSDGNFSNDHMGAN